MLPGVDGHLFPTISHLGVQLERDVGSYNPSLVGEGIQNLLSDNILPGLTKIYLLDLEDVTSFDSSLWSGLEVLCASKSIVLTGKE